MLTICRIIATIAYLVWALLMLPFQFFIWLTGYVAMIIEVIDAAWKEEDA